ncbi:DUF2470 domain-containing protein [Blastococcus sp. CT_GayMR16]|uniref:DUF2470 domain-containing protein n=1 Tax=Blastococcus sp. CT_GayMR16 TaxID=2559607 RepID=UPI0010736A3F|nr:DUF2470 domain-containing protein [Blastococcus sp. CT_GayMR16]TFV86254.1 DUF2470 domain-containing protein [Blastococcus sp. CT_GayMR16]
MTAGSIHSSPAVHRQPPAAERARTIAAAPAVSLYGLGLGICQLWGATTTDAGDVLLVVPTDGVVTAALRDTPLGDVPARLTVTERTPFPVPHPVRGLVQLTGLVASVAEYDVTRLVLDFADVRTCDSLFDVGLSATLLRLEPAEVHLEEAGGTTDVGLDEFLAARPDPVSRAENALVAEHCHALVRLAARIQRRVGRHDSIRLLALDRYGVRFRVQGSAGCYDLRVPFVAPLGGPAGFGAAVDRLLTCGP